MNYNPEKHHRHSIRLQGYDYTQVGAYYFTICCHQRRCLLGEIEDGVMHLNLVGVTVKAVWDSLPRHFPLIELDAFVIMPNHVHGIIVITDSAGNCNPNRNNNLNPNLNSDCRGEAFAYKPLGFPGNLLAQMLRPYTSMTEYERRTPPSLSQFPVTSNTDIFR